MGGDYEKHFKRCFFSKNPSTRHELARSDRLGLDLPAAVADLPAAVAVYHKASSASEAWKSSETAATRAMSAGSQ